MSDLVSGRYGALEPSYQFLGQVANLSQSDVPARTNATVMGWNAWVSGLPGAASEEGYQVAVPVQWGDEYTKVSMLVTVEGKTTPFCFATLYEGTVEGKESKLLAQSKVSAENGEEAQKVGIHGYLLEKGILATPANAPHGFLYAGITCEESTIAKVATVAMPTACQVEWVKGQSPKVLSMNVKQKAKSEAAASFKPETAAAVVPIIILQ